MDGILSQVPVDCSFENWHGDCFLLKHHQVLWFLRSGETVDPKSLMLHDLVWNHLKIPQKLRAFIVCFSSESRRDKPHIRISFLSVMSLSLSEPCRALGPPICWWFCFWVTGRIKIYLNGSNGLMMLNYQNHQIWGCPIFLNPTSRERYDLSEAERCELLDLNYAKKIGLPWAKVKNWMNDWMI